MGHAESTVDLAGASTMALAVGLGSVACGLELPQGPIPRAPAHVRDGQHMHPVLEGDVRHHEREQRKHVAPHRRFAIEPWPGRPSIRTFNYRVQTALDFVSEENSETGPPCLVQAAAPSISARASTCSRMSMRSIAWTSASRGVPARLVAHRPCSPFR